ncbi:MAG: L-seryl-tRNA(Sec) selenium transferase [Anaerolineales bacterium]|nr:L-seryl-tRNA(Sec) selenium transferase [Anaerolineales bacterium]MDW8448041.1 L-seryl-tRNA(Sec) selenium transferase [Anaerolineales bacterium]
MDARRLIPSVERVLQLEAVKSFSQVYGRRLTVEAARQALEQVRQIIVQTGRILEEEEILQRIERHLHTVTTASLLPVINATGVVLHTNLGRAPLSEEAMAAASQVACRYSNLEFDLEQGKRGSRLIHAEKLLCQLIRAEAALVVNNNAAAVLLSLAALANRRKVVIARSQLVEIGGGFRIPDVMRQSGARLLEIGTTNRVNLEDYRSTLEQKPALFLVAHRSNFKILGFTAEPQVAEIAHVAHESGIPLMVDLGSGALLDTAEFGLAHEPTVQEMIESGADLVCFSGDKLMGGPQAGIVVGKRALIEKLRRHPLARAVRADKLALAALSATLLHYLKEEATQKIPIWKMISLPVDEIYRRAWAWTEKLSQLGIKASVIEGTSTIGGGSLPGETLPSHLLAIRTKQPQLFLRKLRENSPPIIARIEQDLVAFDPRTVLADEEAPLLAAIESLREFIL